MDATSAVSIGTVPARLEKIGRPLIVALASVWGPSPNAELY